MPGLAKEVSNICSDLGIEDVNDTNIGKNMLKKMIKKKHVRKKMNVN